VTEFKLLDHGYLEIVETWGSDQAIIEAARMSTNKGFLGGHEGVSRTCENGTRGCALKHVGDEKLLRFLWENKHSTPFEMAGLTIEVKAPILVFREWHRHRVPFGYNEMSARYVPLPNENYSPTVQRIIEGARQAGKNKQAQGVGERIPTEAETQRWLDRLAESYALSQAVYEEGIAIGVTKELARCPVPVARYSRMRATGNLRGWLGFMTLRSAPNAQYEIRVYAEALGKILADKFPRTWELFAEGRP
jgi:thymidylate synthase (FAD)